MNNAARRLMVERLRARLDAGDSLDYPQLTADARSALILLDHFEGDATFLRGEKRIVWGKILRDPDEDAAVVNGLLFVFGLIVGASVALTIYAGSQFGG